MSFLVALPIFVGFALVLVVTIIVGIVRKKKYTRTIASLSVAIVVAFIYLHDEAHKPLFDDGPFQGRPCETLPHERPDQRVELRRGGYVIETWDRRPGHTAPIVALRTPSAKVKWCLYAEASPETTVDRLRFSSSGGLFFGATIDATVEWTFGQERALWFLAPDGSLKEYWYSW